MTTDKEIEYVEAFLSGKQSEQERILEIFKIWALKGFGISVSQSPKFKQFEQKIKEKSK